MKREIKFIFILLNCIIVFHIPYSSKAQNKREKFLAEAFKKRIQEYEVEEDHSWGMQKEEEENVDQEKKKQESKKKIKRKKVNELDLDAIKYRRNSVYTLMIDDESRMYQDVIKNTFGDFEISERFNDFNIGPYLIKSVGSSDDPKPLIDRYLEDNEVAKELVSSWFNRKRNGSFDMNKVAEMGHYDASEFDVEIAQKSKRGYSLISDAGEELIGKTFVVVNSYKYVNKEEVADKVSTGLNILSTVASVVPGGEVVSNVASIASVGATVAGKGYVVVTTSYLYKLVWNDSISSIFYQRFWYDNEDIKYGKKEDYENTKLFKMEYIGSQKDWADLQSSIFTSKTEQELINIATVKATDGAFAKLQRRYEEFRVKTPLVSLVPLGAKIGKKEDVKGGDRFEVLEPYVNYEGKTAYTKMGIITVDGNYIWDNRYMAAEMPNNKDAELKITYFRGGAKGFLPGMLLRQLD